MFVSQARLEANRRNAALSTGPRTPEGKAKSRANALKHGLCASAVVPEGLELVSQRSREFFDTTKPQNEVHVWMVEQAAICSIRIERCQRIERRIRDKMALRAELTWDTDRRFEVEVTARSLQKDPAATVEALRRTVHGCEWMIKRWALLAYAADTQDGAWTDDQVKHAFDLLATPALFREGRKPGISIDDEGRVIEGVDDPAGMARRQIAELKADRDLLADLDEAERHLAASDLVNEGDPELRRLRRYESALFTKLRWCLKQIEIQSPYRLPEPALRPVWMQDLESPPEPEAPPETSLEVNMLVDIPDEGEPAEAVEVEPRGIASASPSARVDKKIRRAAARAEGRRKKADRLRA